MMSGSDGPPGGGMFNTGPADDECSAVRVEDVVAAPDPSFSFFVGVVLEVAIQSSSPVTVGLFSSSTLVGALHPYPALVRCLKSGVPFQAEVLSAHGGDVRVRVEPIP